MVCKEFEELCTKFRNLSPHMRIDIMCGMLRMCLPPELRFIGSVVEDLAKKDYHYLREHEIKANSQTEILKYNNADDRALRRGIALSLSLLHSWNTNCANSIFDLLESSLKHAFEVTTSTDRETIDVILLVLMMAMNHPALSFHQRQVIASHYEIVEQQLESLMKTDNVVVQVPMTSVMTSTCPTCSTACSTATSDCTPVQPTTNQNKVHICNIEMKTEKFHRRHDRRHEYKFQVKWSNGDTNDVSKTQLDLREFHSRLIKLYPEEAGAHKQDRKLPFLGNANMGHREEIDHISDYVGKLVKLPKHILECDHIVQFFKGGNSAPSSPENSPQTKPQPISASVSPIHVTSDHIDTEATLTYLPSRSLTVYNSHLLHHGEAVPICTQTPQIDSNLVLPQQAPPPIQQPLQLSPSINNRHSESSPPVHSPQLTNHIPQEEHIVNHMPQEESVLPVVNHVMQEDSRSMSPAGVSSPDTTAINILMKKLNLNQHQDMLEKFSLEQLSNMNQEELLKLGLSKEEAEKVQIEVETLLSRQKTFPPPPNGLIEPCIPSATISPPLIPWAPPQHCFALHYPDHIPQPPNFPYQPHLPYVYPFPPSNISAASNIRTRNSSPTGSDNSSPSPSPVPQKKSSQLKLSDCSSGEDNDKEHQPAAESPTVEVKNRYNAAYLVDSSRYPGVNKKIDEKKPLISLPTAVAPPTYMTSGVNETSTVQVPVGCGYQSDPTPTGFAPRIPVIATRPPYKAQPAHVSLNIPPKNMISMPPDTHPGKRCSPLIPIAYAPPIPRSEASAITSNVVTAVAGNSVFSMAPSDIGKQRQMVYGIHVQSPITVNGINGNGNRPVTCTVTTSTAIVMATRQANSGSPHQHVVASVSGLQGNGSNQSSPVVDSSISTPSVVADNPSSQSTTPAMPSSVSTVNSHVVRSCSASPNHHLTSSTSHSSCNNCNCNCHTGSGGGGVGSNGSGSASNGNSGINNIQHPYSNIYPNHFAPGHFWHVPYLAAAHTSNGFIPQVYPPGLSYHIPPSNFHNGLNPDVLNSHHSYFQHGIIPVPYSSLGNLLNRGAVYHNTSIRNSGNGKKSRKNCYNCGSSEHIGSECTDKSMESVSGHFQLNYEPKSNSD